MYNYNHLTFLSEVTPQSKSIRFIKIDGVTSHIITNPNCVIRIIKNTLEIKQEHDTATIILDFLNPAVTKIAHDRLREALKLLKNNNTSDQNNIIRTENIGPLNSDLINNWDIDENNINVLINNFFGNYSIQIEENEIIIFNFLFNFFSDSSDQTTFKFSQLRKYIFKSGKGTYLNDITINNLELIELNKSYKFIDLLDVDLANNAGKILIVNNDETSLDFKDLSEIANNGFLTEYYIDLTEELNIEIGLNSKLIINSIDLISGNYNNFKINGNTPVFPIVFNNPPEMLIIENQEDIEINLNVLKFIL